MLYNENDYEWDYITKNYLIHFATLDIAYTIAY